jgi:subtilase family serine protease
MTTVNGTTFSYKDSGLTAIQNYFYKVTAVNAAGEGVGTTVMQANVPADYTIIIIVLAIVVIAVVAAVAVIMMRRRKK